jgi:hypothetical protein
LAACHNGAVEISTVRNQLTRAIEAARHRNQRRRELTAEAERGFQLFLEQVATPVTKMLATALKAEGHQFTAFTPGGGLRLASDTRRDDYIDFALDTDAEPPQVVGRISRTRGSRTLSDERPVKPGTAPGAITEEDVLAFLLTAIEPWLER